MWVPEEQKDSGKMFEMMMAKHFLKLMTKYKVEIQEKKKP